MNKWRKQAIIAIDAETKVGKALGLSGAELEAHVRKHGYPFGEREMHPYKIWCDVMRKRFGSKSKPTGKGSPGTEAKLAAYNEMIAKMQAAKEAS